MEWAVIKNTKIEIITTRKNGDCLFSALAHQLFNSHPHSQENTIQCNMLRSEVAEYIERNPEEFVNQIISNYLDEDDKQNEELNKIGLVHKFCKKIRRAGEWGGGETISVVAKLYNVSILIYMEEGESFRINQNEKETRELAIIYRKGKEGYNHYDSIINSLDNKEPNKGWEGTEKEKRYREEKEYQLNIMEISEEQDIGFIVKLNNKTSQEQRNSIKEDLRIATWNVRGCANPKKRENIDEALDFMKIDIVGIQETHLSSGRGETKNYYWWNAGNEGNRETRGVAIVIKKNCNLKVNDFIIFSDSICSIKLIWGKTPITLIVAHISSESDLRNKVHLAELHKALSNAQPSTSIIILGDLNAHFGTSDRSKSETKWIGPKLYHKTTNENGNHLKMLMEIFHLTLHNTWSQSKTVLTTWTNGTACSQLDHIMSTYSNKIINYIKAKWMNSVETDHKILYGWLKKMEIEGIKVKGKQEIHSNPKKLRWTMNALNDPPTQEKFNCEIQVALNELDTKLEHPKTVEGKWVEIKEVLTIAANNTLAIQRSPLTPRRRKSIAKQKKGRFLRQRYPKDEEIKIDLKIANSERKQADRNHFLTKCEKFIMNLRWIHPNQRIKEMYKLIKVHKVITGKKNTQYIPMSKWEELLQSESGKKLELILEKDGKPLPPPPSLDLVKKWLRVGKKGRAPGIDNINLELIANAPIGLIKDIVGILGEAWGKNEIPSEWSTSLQVPLPKIKCPKDTNNYRRISLCTVIYKLYTKYILHCLDEILPETPSYQAAFLPERSTDDHIFTLGRILEERWRSGSKTYVVTLDIEKAFDSISHEAIVIILKQNKVPHKLINRIIKTSLNEETMIQWCGQRTKRIIKGMGVKQGCPLSPRLFNIAINEVLQTIAEVIPFINLEQTNFITLPLILVFADDIIIVAENNSEIQQIIDELIGTLLSIGLKLNPEKCQMLVRDPMELIPSKWTPKIGQTPIAIVNKLKYLGVIITNKLDRRIHMKDRVKKAYKTTHTILPFLQRHHLPWNLTKIIYEMLIIPTVTYGMKTTVLTKANRNSLRNMERDLIGILAGTCYPRVTNKSANKLLNKRSIIRKITMLRIRYWGHIIRRAEGHILRTVLNYRTKKKKIGRPCLTWISNLEKDKAKYDWLGVDWSQTLQDKKETAATSKEIYTLPDDTDSEEVEYEEE